MQRFHARFHSTTVNFVSFLRHTHTHTLECIRSDLICVAPKWKLNFKTTKWNCVRICYVENCWTIWSRFVVIFSFYTSVCVCVSCVINRIVLRNASGKYQCAMCVLNWMPIVSAVSQLKGWEVVRISLFALSYVLRSTKSQKQNKWKHISSHWYNNAVLTRGPPAKSCACVLKVRVIEYERSLIYGILTSVKCRKVKKKENYGQHDSWHGARSNNRIERIVNCNTVSILGNKKKRTSTELFVFRTESVLRFF